MKKYVLTACLSFLSVLLYSQNQQVKHNEYINKYAPLAVSEMKRSGVPASITLAQGMLESDCGASILARKSNNHFGIKCHDTWTGEKVYFDDDAKGECFRKYKNPEQSFIDHTDFLVHTRRYAPLFELEQDDYKGWARGLKKCGYATHPEYAERLIKIIEEDKLYEFDKGVVVSRVIPVEVSTSKRAQKMKVESSDEFSVRIGRQILMRNRIDYIVVKRTDTFEKLNKELDMLAFELRKYNDLPEDYNLKEGDILYLQPKRKKADVGFGHHIVKDGETMQDISQLYGVKMKSLYRMNLMDPGTQPVAGQKISLRKKLKKN